MSRWFRFYDDAINDPKILKLSDKLHRIWIGILCIASKNNGDLPSLEDMALLIRIKPEKLHPSLEELEKFGLIDRNGPLLKPHNWDGRQYKSDVSTERVKRFRNAKRNVAVTPPDTESDTDTEIKEDSSAANAATIPEWFEEMPEDRYWAMGPQAEAKGIKKSQMGQLAKLLHGDFEEAIDTLERSLRIPVTPKGTPAKYFAGAVRRIEREQRAQEAPLDDGAPEFVRQARAERMVVEQLSQGRWKIGGQTFDERGSLIGW